MNEAEQASLTFDRIVRLQDENDQLKAEVKRAMKENEGLANLLWEHPTAPCDQDSVFESMQRVKALREQNKNLLIQQAHEESIRAEIKTELVHANGVLSRVKSELDTAKHELSMIAADVESYRTDCSTPVFQMVRNMKEECDQLKAEFYE